MKFFLLLLGIIFFLTELNSTVYSQDFSSSNLPIVVIDTHGQFIDTAGQKFIVKVGIVYNGPGVRNHITDAFNGYNGDVEIKLHGSSTLYLPKKSYSITTLNAVHQQENVSLLGMPPENDWVFKALYQDKTFLRDELAFRLFNEMGSYSSRSKFFELVINGDYRGVYQLEEKIKQNVSRVNIFKLQSTDISGDALTGGYIISLDKYLPGDPGWFSKYSSNLTHDSANYFLYYEPKATNMPPEQRNYIKNFFDKFENVMVSSYFDNPDSGYGKYLNIPSFVDNFLINEISRNVDGYRSSTYFYKDRDSRGDGKVHASPIWDFNLAWDNASYNGAYDPAGWQYQQFANINFVPFWWWQIMSDNAFKNQLKCRYQSLRGSIFSLSAINHFIDSMTLYLDESQIRNFERWPILGYTVYPNPSPVPQSYAGEIANLKNWIQQRLVWMDTHILGICNTGIQENPFAENPIQSFPNPFVDHLSIVYTVPENPDQPGQTKVKIELLNVLGVQVQSVLSENKMTGTYQEEIYVRHLSPGIYLLKLSLNELVCYQKITKLQ